MPNNDNGISVGWCRTGGIGHKNGGCQSCSSTSPISAFHLKILVPGCGERLRSVKHPQQVAWGVILATGVGSLCFLKGTMSAAVYQEMLDSFLVATVEDYFGNKHFIFQQNLAPLHTTKTAKK